MATSGMIIDGIAASEAIDSSGEILEVENCDISDLEKGLGTLNWEHKDEKVPDHTALDHVGKIVYAKKIFEKSDCDTDRQRDYWDAVKLPYIYIMARLYDGAGHPAAMAVAAMFRDAEANNEPVLVRYSIEGATLLKKGNRIVNSMARRVSATIKPCNRSCASGIVSDPQDGGADKSKFTVKVTDDKSLKRLIETVEKSERLNPSLMLLGKGIEHEYKPVDLSKTLSAGSYNAAPGSLVGGAALQVEDRSRKLKDVTKRAVDALKKWDKSCDLKEHLRKELPDVDPNFIDECASMAEGFDVQKKDLKKNSAEMGDEPAPIDTKKDLRVVVAPVHKEMFKKQKGPRPYPKSPGESYFDEGAGILHTDQGSFPMNIPNDTKYKGVLNGPEVQPHHDEAMKHWLNLNALLREGKLPQEVVMHAALFSGMSPSCAVPMQELAFSHVQDLINKGMDPTVKGSASDAFKEDFMRRTGKGTASLPDYLNDYWRSPSGDATRIKGSNQMGLFTDQAPNAQKGLLYPGQKWRSVSAYYKLHPELTRLVGQYGADARAITRKLLEYKVQGNSFKQKQTLQATKGHEPKSFHESTGLPDVEGFAPKTVRYLLAMLGGGNVHVPDTHFIRHVFGLPTDKAVRQAAEAHIGRQLQETAKTKEVPFDPNEHLKRVLWDDKNHEIGEAIDRYYTKHHPAVKYVQNRFFAGQPTEQATFPAFWAHWLSVGPHERALGMGHPQNNAGTDHRVYWNTVNQTLQKYGLPHVPLHKTEGVDADTPLAYRTAAAHAELEHALGEGPALFAYHHTLLPLLLQEHKRNQQTMAPSIMKMESLMLDLKKAQEALVADPKGVAGDYPVTQWAGKHVKPGVIQFHNTHQGHKALPLVDYDGHDYWAIHPDALGGDDVKSGHLFRVPKEGLGTHFSIDRMPEKVHVPNRIDSKVHGVKEFLDTPEQHALIHGTDMRSREGVSGAGRGINKDTSHFRTMANGQKAYIKEADPEVEGAYADVARSIFGMGKYVPNTAVFKDPEDNKKKVAIGVFPNAIHASGDYGDGGKYTPHPDFIDAYERTNQNGDLEKLAFMNNILMNDDRHAGNYMFAPEREKESDPARKLALKLIDHGYTLNSNNPTPRRTTPMPTYFTQYLQSKGLNFRPDTEAPFNWTSHKLHPDTVEWIKKLDAKKLESELLRKYITPTVAAEAKRRILALQSAAERHKERGLHLGTAWHVMQSPDVYNYPVAGNSDKSWGRVTA